MCCLNPLRCCCVCHQQQRRSRYVSLQPKTSPAALLLTFLNFTEKTVLSWNIHAGFGLASPERMEQHNSPLHAQLLQRCVHLCTQEATEFEVILLPSTTLVSTPTLGSPSLKTAGPCCSSSPPLTLVLCPCVCAEGSTPWALAASLGLFFTAGWPLPGGCCINHATARKRSFEASSSRRNSHRSAARST